MTNIRRREALGVGLAALGSAAFLDIKTSAPAWAATDPSLLLKAVVTIGSATYEYREENGRDLGDFVSAIGGFTQGCTRVDVTGSPLSVFFRPDRTSSRVEVVFELGRLWASSPAHLGAYSVAISRGGALLATVSVPNHYWFSRWRWQSAPRPVVGDVAALIQQNLLPPYDRSAVAPPPAPAPVLPAHPYQVPNADWIDLDVLKEISGGNYADVGKLVVTSLMNSSSLTSAPAAAASTPASTTAPAIGPAQTYTIMGIAGLTAYMPQTGERPDIGPVTEPQAQYICTAAQAALDTVRAQGEAGGTMPWHMRDENTGAPIDFRTYPKASWYPDGSPGAPQIKVIGCPVTLDSAHMPGIVYLPYLLTGDPYHLEDLQFQANWNWGWYNPTYRPSIGQSRQFAWNLRTLAQVVKMSPATVPSWLLPQSHWVAQLDTWRQHFTVNYINSPRADKAIFRTCTPIDSSGDQGPTAPYGTWVDMWEDEFVATILGWVVDMGFTEWRPAFDWKIGSTIARSSVGSGWVRAQATPYRTILRASYTAPFADSWASAFALTKTTTGIVVVDPNTWYPSDMTYLTYTRGSLFYANRLGTAGAPEPLAWSTTQLKGKAWKTDYKWRIGTGL